VFKKETNFDLVLLFFHLRHNLETFNAYYMDEHHSAARGRRGNGSWAIYTYIYSWKKV